MSSSFDCFDVLEQSPASESQEQTNEILYKEKNSQTFETLTGLGFDLPSNHSSDSEDSEGSSDDSDTPRKSKKITKPKRSRKLTENSTWTKKD